MPKDIHRVGYSVSINGMPMAINVGIAATQEQARIYSLCHYIENKDITDANKIIQIEKFSKNYGIELNRESWNEYFVWLKNLDKHATSVNNKKITSNRNKIGAPLDEPMSEEDRESILEFLKGNDGNGLILDAEGKVGLSNEIASVNKFPVKYSFVRNGIREIVNLGEVADSDKAMKYTTLHYISNPDISLRNKKIHRESFNYEITEEIKEEYKSWIKDRLHTQKRKADMDNNGLTNSVSSSHKRHKHD